MDESPQEALKRAIKAAGNASALARGLKIKPPAVAQWKRVPAGRVLDVERLTGVPKELLRPDLYREAAE